MVPVLDINDNVVLDHDEFIRPDTTVETLRQLKPSFAAMGDMGGFDAVALQKYHWVEKIDHVHTPATRRGSSTAPRWWRSATSRSAPSSG